MNVYVFCAAILVLVYFLLACHVSLTRGRMKVNIGSGDQPSGPLNKSIRAHGNAAEYIPLFVALFLYFGAVGARGWIEWAVIVVTLSRILHPLGMFLSPDLRRPQVFRALGALGTYAGGFALGVAMLMRAW
jgi:uncharacterized membrane protein YecN with MAPEG domain